MRKGSKHTKESLEKLSESLKGRDVWNKGKKMVHSGSFKKGHKGYINSGNFKKGMIPWNKGKELEDKYILKGEKHGNWKGGRLKTTQGYILIWKAKHPFRSKKGYVMEHRLVMEEYLGRYLTPEERVHHIDENKSNNVIGNLLFLPNESAHRKLHIKLSKLSLK